MSNRRKNIYKALTFFHNISKFQIFTRILRSLNLPVGTSQMIVPRYITNAYDISHVVLWISSLLVSLLFIHVIFTFNYRTSVKYCLIDSHLVKFREDPASKLKHSSLAFSTVLHPSSTHQTMAAGWWVSFFSLLMTVEAVWWFLQFPDRLSSGNIISVKFPVVFLRMSHVFLWHVGVQAVEKHPLFHTYQDFNDKDKGQKRWCLVNTYSLMNSPYFRLW